MILDQLLMMGLGAAVFTITVALLAASPIPAVVATAGLFLVTAVTGAIPTTFVGDIQVFATDVLFVAAAIAAVVRSLRGFVGFPARRVAMALVVVMGWSLVLGTLTFGVERAGEEVRQIFYFLAGISYFQTVDVTPRHVRAIGRCLGATVVALVFLAGLRWAATGSFGSAGTGTYENGVYTTGRLLTASAALLVWQGALALLGLRGVTPLTKWAGAGSLIVLTVLLQHRTIWTIAALTLVLFVLIVRGAPRLAFAGLLVVALVVVSLPTGGTENDLTSALSSSVTEVTERRSTLSWRVEGWGELIDELADSAFVYQLFGLPFGSGYQRAVSGTTVAVSPHNFYVTLLLRMGVAGLLLMLTYFTLVLRDSFRLRREATAISLILLSQVLFFLTYEPTFEQGVVAGVAAAVVRASVPATRAAVAARPQRARASRPSSVGA